MKKLLAGAILAVGLAWSPAWASTPKDTLVVAKNIDDMITLDPAETYELSGGEIVSNLYDRLVGYEQEDIKKLVPTLAESYTVSDDGKTITFKLRPGLKFQSGNPVTADDVVFSMQRVIALNLTPAFILTQFGWTPANVTQLVKAIDPTTVSITVTEDLAPTFVLNCLSAGVASIVDKKLAMQHDKNGDFGHDWLKTHSAGSGPYSLKAWKANESVAMDAFPGARHAAVQMKRVIIRHVPEASAQRLQLEKGDIDVARNLTPDMLKGVAGNKDIAVEADPKSVIYYMGLSQKIEPLAKPKVREAIRWLIDYQGMADTFLKGSYKVHQAFWPSGSSTSPRPRRCSPKPATPTASRCRSTPATAHPSPTLRSRSSRPSPRPASRRASSPPNRSRSSPSTGRATPRSSCSTGTPTISTRTPTPTSSAATRTTPTLPRRRAWPGAIPGTSRS